jgi:subtilisin family serine protease
MVVLLFALAGVTALALSRAATDEPPVEEQMSVAEIASEQIIVRYKPNTDRKALGGQIRALSVETEEKKDLGDLRMKVIKVPKAARETVIKALSKNPNIEFAEPDTVESIDVTTPNDPEYTSAPQWVWPKTQTNIAWDTTKGSQGVVIAVIDSGINFTHPEFAGKTVPGKDFVNDDNDPTDDNKHGTAVAGVIGAVSNNAIGVASACWECRIMPLKVMNNSGSGNMSDIVEGIQYAANNGAKIMNLSLSGTGESSSQKSAVDYAHSKGVIVVGSAGNEGTDVPRRPGKYPNAIAVAATDQNDKLTSYSSFGQHVDIAAPGQARVPAHNSNGFITINGTSFSAPTVAGILGLLWSAVPTATPAELRYAIEKTADPCCDGKIAGGRINAAKALERLKQGNIPVPVNTPPTVSFTAPAANAIVDRVVTVTATATDNTGVAKVELQVDNGRAMTDIAAPYSFTWSTIGVADGVHTLKLTAYDTEGNTSTATRVVNVRVAPATKVGDLNGDGQVGIADLSQLMSAWGTNNPTADLDRNGTVNIGDLSILMSKWGS